MSRKKNPGRGPGLDDVAEKAGVSLATASRVLSNSTYNVSPKMRKRVIEAANALNYSPAPRSSVYTQEEFRIIAVIVPTLQNPFFNEVILGVESVASRLGYQVMVFSSHRSVEEERKSINSLLHSRITALIIISIDSNSETLNNYIACGGKVALLESNFRLDHTIMTKTDYPSAGRLAAEHLISCGHKDIAFFTSPLTKTYRRGILIGIREAIKEAGLSFPDSNIFIASGESESEAGAYEFEMGKQLVSEYLRRPKKKFTAIIAINDLTAFGIIQALTHHGISVPDDVSVISFDNISYSAMISPPLTTVDLPSSSLGSSACSMLINTLSGMEEGLTGIVFDFQGKLEERESVSHIRSRL